MTTVVDWEGATEGEGETDMVKSSRGLSFVERTRCYRLSNITKITVSSGQGLKEDCVIIYNENVLLYVQNITIVDWVFIPRPHTGFSKSFLSVSPMRVKRHVTYLPTSTGG